MGAPEVAKGAEWLDENFPGWERDIDLGNFNLSSCTNCVCGQSLAKFVEGTFCSGYSYALATAMGLPIDELDTAVYELNSMIYESLVWAKAHGFFGDWERNEALWRELIKERFSNGTLSG